MEFRVLGALEVITEDRQIPFSATREGALLAILLIHAGEVVSADRLIDQLWRGEPTEGAPATLQTYVRDLRRVLEPTRRAGATSEVLTTRRPGYLLRVGPESLDASRFERLADEAHRDLLGARPKRAADQLRTALGMWRGRPFGELSTEPFALSEVARLEERRLCAVEDRVEADLTLGHHTELVGELEALVAEHPYRERLWGQLLLALYRSGRQAEALRAFGRVRGLLGEELGIEPNTSLRTLEEAILLQKADLDWTPAGDVSEAGSTSSQPGSSGRVGGGEATITTEESETTDILTFLLTDLEGSAMLWEEAPKAMASALARHDELVADILRSCQGRLVKNRGEGDSTFAVFRLASDAAAAAACLGRAFANEPWPSEAPLRVRIVVNTGEATARGGDYFGGTINRAARLRSLALGGEILLSETTASLVLDAPPHGCRVVDRGWQILRDLRRPEHVFELSLDDSDTARDQRDDDSGASNLTWVPPAPSVFVGRSAELCSLETSWARAVGGERSLVLVAGDAGIGKTRVAAEMAGKVHESGGLVLYGRWDEEALWPYQALREALGYYASVSPRATLRSDLREYVRELTPLLPVLGERVGGGVPLRGEPDSDRYRLFEAIDGWLTALASRRPVLLVLDDLHWADRPSLLVLEHLMRRAHPSRLLILATCCLPEVQPGSEIVGVLANLRRRANIQRMTVGGLSADEVLDLFERLAGHQLGERASGLAERLQRETCGNPFFLWEMTRHLVETGIASEHGGRWDATVDADVVDVPESVREVVEARVARLSGGCRIFLNAASLMGEEFRAGIAREASDTSEDSLLAILDEAMQAGMVDEVSATTNRYAFAHAVVRHTVHDSMSHSRRMYTHRRIGLALERQCGRSGPHLAELAYHLCEGASAGSADDAVHYAQLAAQQAILEVAYEAAGIHLRRAIDMVDRQEPRDEALRCRLLLALGDAHNKAGDIAAGCDRFVEAADAARALDSSEHLAAAAIGFGGVLPAAVEPSPRARSLLEEALERLGSADSTARALALGRLAHWLNLEGSRTERVALCNDAVAMARRLGDPATIAAVLSYRYWALDGPDDVVSQSEAGAEIVKLGEKLGDKEIVLQGYKGQLHALFELGQTGAAGDVARSMGRLADELRQPEYLRLAMMWETTIAGLQGRFEEAKRLAAETRALLRQSGHPQEQVIYFALTLPWRWLCGGMEEIVPALERAVERRAPTLTWPALLAWAYVESGHPKQASETLDAIGLSTVRDMDQNFYWWTVVVALANTATALGDTDWTELLASMMAPYRDHNSTVGQSLFLGAASHHLGVMMCSLRRWDQALEYLDQALERHENMGARPFVALTTRAYATALCGRDGPGDRERARDLRHAAARTATELHLRALALRDPS